MADRNMATLEDERAKFLMRAAYAFGRIMSGLRLKALSAAHMCSFEVQNL